MKGLLALLMITLTASGQRIETESANRSAVKRLETAVDHLTVLEFAEPVTMAAAGSPAFKIERQGNKVFIQPLEQGASTNLFIWTASSRFTYELKPAGSVEEAHFAVDQALPLLEATIEPQVKPTAEGLAAEIVLNGMPIRGVDLDSGQSDVQIVVTDVLERSGELLVRYTIDNRSRRPYAPVGPAAVLLRSPRSPVSLLIWRYCQVGEKIARNIGANGRRPLKVTEVGAPVTALDPGERGSGLVAVDLPSRSDPAVLELSFPSNSGAPIAVTLVL